jgi:hypothetical protein
LNAPGSVTQPLRLDYEVKNWFYKVLLFEWVNLCRYAEAMEASQGLLTQELERGTGLNPLRWLAHASGGAVQVDSSLPIA